MIFKLLAALDQKHRVQNIPEIPVQSAGLKRGIPLQRALKADQFQIDAFFFKKPFFLADQKRQHIHDRQYAETEFFPG